MSDVFDEVEESLRQDKAMALWKRFRWLLIGAAAAAVLATAVVGIWQYYQEQAADSRAREFESALTALEAQDYPTALAGFEALATSGTSIAPLAANYLAQARIEGQGDREGAAAALQIAIDGDDPVMANISRLKLAYLRADTVSLEELETLLRPLRNRDNRMETLAVELIAAKAYAEGDFARARREYGFLSISPNAPQSLKQRAEQALAVIPPASDAAPTTPETSLDDGESQLPSGPEDTTTDTETTEEPQ